MFYRETEFIDTAIGSFPRNWNKAKLADVAEYINGYHFSPQDWKDEGLPIIRIQNLNDLDAEFNYFDGGIDDKYIIQDGDLLFSWSASIGAHIWKRGRAVLNQHIFKVVPKDNITKPYLFYALFLAIEQLKSRVHGSTMKHFKKEELHTIIPLPSLSEQKKIVEVLSCVDLAIQKTEEVLSKTERLKRGLMQKLLTEGIGHKEYKDTPIGKIPNHWQVAQLGEYVDFRNGINFNSEQRTSIGTLTIDVRNMYGEGIYVDLKDLYRVSISENEDCLLRKGDVLFVRSSLKREGAGWVSLFGGSAEPVTFCSFIIRARLRENSTLLPEFLTHFLRSNVARRKLVATAGQVAISNITQDSLNALLFPIPPLKEQQRIADIIATIDEKMRFERIEKTKVEHIKQGLMDLLLTGKVRVKVD